METSCHSRENENPAELGFKMPYLYILECSDKSYYTGSAIDLEKELQNHQKGKGVKYTKQRLPVELVFVQEFEDINDAYRCEKLLKGWSHNKKRALIESDTELIHL